MIVGLTVIIAGCSPEYHFKKFKAKGGEINPVTRVVQLTDTIYKDGDTNYITRYLEVECPEPIIETRWKVRFDNKRFKDSIKYVHRMYKDSVKTVVKEKRIEGRTIVRTERAKGKWWLWLMIGIVIGYVLQPILTILGAFKNLPTGRK